MMKYFLFFERLLICLKACVVSCLKLRYIHTVNVPLPSKTNGFQSEVKFTHAADYFFILNSCF